MSQLTAPPSDPVLAPPVRRPGSVRRTSTVLMSWPGGLGTRAAPQGTGPRSPARRLEGSPRSSAKRSLPRSPAASATSSASRPIRLPPGLELWSASVPAAACARRHRTGELPEEASERHAAVPAARRPGWIDVDLRLRVLPLADHLPEMRERFTKAPPTVMEGICSGFRRDPSHSDDGSIIHVRQNTARTRARWRIRPIRWAGMSSRSHPWSACGAPAASTCG